MSKELTLWLLILAVGVINYAARLSFIALFARHDMPPLLAQGLKHIPVAMLTAIVIPAVVFISPGVLRMDPGNARLVAALVAGAVAWWRQSALLTIASGMVVLWALQYLMR